MDAAMDPGWRDPFTSIDATVVDGEFADLLRRPLSTAVPAATGSGASLAVFHGFGVLDEPLLTGLASLPGEIVAARTVVAMRRDMVGASVVWIGEGGDARRPIILGVLQDSVPATGAGAQPLSVQADDERVLISAEREVVLKCGDASITLTRAGRVLIRGTFVLSHASGCNRIKGAAVDIN
ncbi:MAG TPA: DUF6484 domain-containing protein [Albitalea sp.]|jgi:hypothetical protein|nr:DUF6484 domain-containing protein [Albitalea sp.]